MAINPGITFSFSNPYRPANSGWPNLLKTWIPVLLFTGVFAAESTAAFGANHTSAPLHSLFHALFGSTIDPYWSEIHHILRKTGHFTGYGLFSLACFRGVQGTLDRRNSLRLSAPEKLRIAHLLAVAGAFLVASADEIHQTFLPNRTGCFADVLLDTGGAAVLQIGLLFAMRISALRRNRPAAFQVPSELPLAA